MTISKLAALRTQLVAPAIAGLVGWVSVVQGQAVPAPTPPPVARPSPPVYAPPPAIPQIPAVPPPAPVPEVPERAPPRVPRAAPPSPAVPTESAPVLTIRVAPEPAVEEGPDFVRFRSLDITPVGQRLAVIVKRIAGAQFQQDVKQVRIKSSPAIVLSVSPGGSVQVEGANPHSVDRVTISVGGSPPDLAHQAHAHPHAPHHSKEVCQIYRNGESQCWELP